jgi:hypothetical protein
MRKKMKTYKLKNRNTVTRKHLVSILDWCRRNLGKSDFFDNETLRIRICTKMRNFMGEFDVEKNCIYVNPKKNNDELDLIATVIHEYVHFRQDYKEYERIELQLPRRRNYFDHPLEREAEDMAQLLKAKCYSDLKSELGW